MFKYLVVSLLVLSTASLAQETENETGPATLEIGIQAMGLALSLSAPGLDIVGFDLPARDNAQRAQVAAAVSELSRPLKLFVVAPAADCVTVSANVALVETPGGDGRKAPEFEAEYMIRCRNISAVTDLRAAYFDRFPKARGLNVLVQSETGTRRFDLTPQSPVADLSGLT